AEPRRDPVGFGGGAVPGGLHECRELGVGDGGGLHPETGQFHRVEWGFPVLRVALTVAVAHGEGTGGDVHELTRGLHGDGWRHCSGTASVCHDRRRPGREFCTGGGARAMQWSGLLLRSVTIY